MTPDKTQLILPALFAIAMATYAYVGFGPIPGAVFTMAFGGGLVLFINTTWRTPIDTARVMIPYLATILLFLLHTYEEYVFNFENTVSALSGEPVSEFAMLTLIAWIAPAIWIFGAIFLLKRWSFGLYFLCAFIVAMTIAELTHFIFPFVIDGTFHYEAGMYSAALPLFAAWWAAIVMMREVRSARTT